LADLDPIAEERARCVGRTKARDDVPGEIDGVELDMRQGVEQGDALLDAAAGLALRHLARRQQERLDRSRRALWWRCRRDEGRTPLAPIRGQRLCARHLLRGVRRFEDAARALREIDHAASAKPFTSFSTSSTWPGTFTLRQMPRITPLPSIRKVARSMPMYLR